MGFSWVTHKTLCLVLHDKNLKYTNEPCIAYILAAAPAFGYKQACAKIRDCNKELTLTAHWKNTEKKVREKTIVMLTTPSSLLLNYLLLIKYFLCFSFQELPYP